jgi:hypothetical protein
MAFKVGDEVQSKHVLKNCGMLGFGSVGKGKKGKVVKVSAWSDQIEVDFDGTKCKVTDKDIERKGFWS